MADDPEAPGSSDGPSKTAVGGIPDLRHIPRGRRGPDRGSRPLQARRAAVRQRTPGNLGGGGPTGGPEILHSHGGLRAEIQYFRGGCPHPAGNDETGPRNRRATLFSDRRRKAGAVPGMDHAIPPSAPQGQGAADPGKIQAPRRPERGHPLVRLTSGEGFKGPHFPGANPTGRRPAYLTGPAPGRQGEGHPRATRRGLCKGTTPSFCTGFAKPKPTIPCPFLPYFSPVSTKSFNRASRSFQNPSKWESHSFSSRRGSDRRRYRFSRPSSLSTPSPASANMRSCLDTAVRLMGKWAAILVTDISCSASSFRICRRVGAAIA